MRQPNALTQLFANSAMLRQQAAEGRQYFPTDNIGVVFPERVPQPIGYGIQTVDTLAKHLPVIARHGVLAFQMPVVLGVYVKFLNVLWYTLLDGVFKDGTSIFLSTLRSRFSMRSRSPPMVMQIDSML